MRIRLLAAVMAVAIAACGGGSSGTTVVEGVVIAVDGTLAGVASFTLRLPDGRDLVLVPVDGVLFDGSAPISHVRDHLASGAPVRVAYEVRDDGSLSAVVVEDG